MAILNAESRDQAMFVFASAGCVENCRFDAWNSDEILWADVVVGTRHATRKTRLTFEISK